MAYVKVDYPEVNCVGCGKEYKPSTKRQKTCGHYLCQRHNRRGDVQPSYYERLTTKECPQCGSNFESANRKKKFCSNDCKIRFAVAQRLTTIYGCACGQCGTVMEQSRANQKFCSEVCRNASNRERRRVREKNLPYEQINRRDIRNRDNNLCHLCHTIVLSDEETLDHLIPIAKPNSPGHVKENVALAHSRCNKSKGIRYTKHDIDLHNQLKVYHGR